MLINYTMWSSNLFSASSCFPRFLSPRFLGSRSRVWVQVLEVALHDWFPMKFVFTYISLVWWELNKRRSKVQEKNILCERALNFDHWKTFSKNYKLMRVWLWLAHKFTDNYYRSWLSPSSFKHKRYPTSLDNICLGKSLGYCLLPR